jgi:hypothetical protein
VTNNQYNPDPLISREGTSFDVGLVLLKNAAIYRSAYAALYQSLIHVARSWPWG